MKTYCNARIPVESPAHEMTSAARTKVLNDWLCAVPDSDVMSFSRRIKRVKNAPGATSVALGLSAEQSVRLSRLLDGRWQTFSALVRRVFEREE